MGRGGIKMETNKFNIGDQVISTTGRVFAVASIKLEKGTCYYSSKENPELNWTHAHLDKYVKPEPRKLYAYNRLDTLNGLVEFSIYDHAKTYGYTRAEWFDIEYKP